MLNTFLDYQIASRKKPGYKISSWSGIKVKWTEPQTVNLNTRNANTLFSLLIEKNESNKDSKIVCFERIIKYFSSYAEVTKSAPPEDWKIKLKLMWCLDWLDEVHTFFYGMADILDIKNEKER